MIVDSSALVAVIRGEPERDRLREAMDEADRLRMSAGTHLESAIVVDRSGDPAQAARFDRLIHAYPIEIAPVTREHARIARQAYRDYGKGSGHPAQLNFGDCFAYALAIDLDEPLLFKGDDFGHTGVRVAG